MQVGHPSVGVSLRHLGQNFLGAAGCLPFSILINCLCLLYLSVSSMFCMTLYFLDTATLQITHVSCPTRQQRAVQRFSTALPTQH